MAFAYLRDPLFLACFTLYWLNRLVITRLPHPHFFDRHFNDLICIPFLVPMLLFAARVCRLRDHDEPPRAHEVVIPLLIWSILFEIILPGQPLWARWVSGDPYDVLYYCLGTCCAMCYWQWRYPGIPDNLPDRLPGFW